MIAGGDEAGGLARGVVGSAGRAHHVRRLAVLRAQHRPVRWPAPVGRLGLHVQQPRPGAGRGFPYRLDDDLRVRPVRARRRRSDQRVRVATAGQHAARDHCSMGPVHRRPDRRGFPRLPRHHHLSLRRSAPRGRGNSGHRGAGRHHLGEDRPRPLLGGGALAGIVAQPAAHRPHGRDDLRLYRLRRFRGGGRAGRGGHECAPLRPGEHRRRRRRDRDLLPARGLRRSIRPGAARDRGLHRPG
jgi:hypothetical protein